MELPKKYNEIPPLDKKVVREEYEKRQGYKCWFCGEPLNGPPHKRVLKNKIHKSLYPKEFFNNPVHLHHSHETGFTIGAVHAYCNAVLWEYYEE